MCLKSHVWKLIAKTGLLVGAASAFTIAEANEQQAVEQRAKDEIVRMSDFLRESDALSFSVLATTEDVSSTLQKLQFDNEINGALKRPDKIYLEKKGYENVVLWFDGKTATIADHNKKKFVRLQISGEISDLIENLEDLGVEAPFAGLMQEGLPAQVDNLVFKGDFYGDALINGVKSNHLAMRQDAIDWQLWTCQQSHAPQKIVVTSKMLSGMPQHQLLFKSLDRNPMLSDQTFKPAVPADYEEVVLTDEGLESNFDSAW